MCHLHILLHSNIKHVDLSVCSSLVNDQTLGTVGYRCKVCEPTGRSAPFFVKENKACGAGIFFFFLARICLSLRVSILIVWFSYPLIVATPNDLGFAACLAILWLSISQCDLISSDDLHNHFHTEIENVLDKSSTNSCTHAFSVTMKLILRYGKIHACVLPFFF